MHRKLRADGSELFARRGDGTEPKSNCGSLSAWRRTVATCLVIGGLAQVVRSSLAADKNDVKNFK